ncbi:MAG: efflux RND transporter periplasmic adaptor subunit [Deltaproteobacteria bacterium]|nr:efflux RND transporter periplasmic adaptor subunit [Deltaproteobacteria bacterium]
MKIKTAYLLLAVIFLLSRASFAQDDKKDSQVTKASVVVTQAKQMIFEDRVETSGNLETRNFSMVSARMPGIIDEIFVREGDQVVAGKTKLFMIDKVKSSQAIDIAKHAVSVSESRHRARVATVNRIEADFTKAKIDYERFKRLYENNNAVTKNALESQESRYIQTRAALEEAKAMADLSKKELEQEQARLVMAQKDYENAMGISPISGYVSKRFREPGEMAGAGSPIVQIDDLSVIEVSAYLPAAYYQKVVINETTMNITVGSINAGDRPVVYKSPVIDNRLRNFEIKALLKNPPEGVTSGDIARIKVILQAHSGTGVPRGATLKKLDGTRIFIAEQGKAKMAHVETGLENDGWIEIISKDIKPGTAVVIMGQDRLSDGAPVTVLREEE